VSLYVDSSALLKRYVDEPDSDACNAILSSDPMLVTGRHTVVELRRNLARLVAPTDLAGVRAFVEEDLAALSIIELDATTCDAAAAIAELTGVRTLDALHLGAAQRAGGTALAFVTYDLRQAQAARSLGFTVLGA
jgi:predicted nucleic acid-binding protein